MKGVRMLIFEMLPPGTPSIGTTLMTVDLARSYVVAFNDLEHF